MKTENKILATVVGMALLAAGCDPSAQQSSAPSTRPAVVTTQALEQAPAVTAAYPARPPSVFTIDGHDVSFPAARLAVVSRRNGLTLRLMSDDPQAAIDPGYVGNSFSMDMQFVLDRVEDLPGATWDHKPADEDDSVSGIFIHGVRDGLRPYDVHVTFQKTDKDIRAYVEGIFLHEDTQNPVAAPQRVRVSACLLINAVE